MDANTWSFWTIGVKVDSNGQPITGIMWRANRLVDFLAKSAASPHRLPKKTVETVKVAATLLQHSAAILGAATHRANNLLVEELLPDGTTAKHRKRDSTAESMWRVAKKVKASPKKLPSPTAVKQKEVKTGTAAKAVLPDTGKFAGKKVDHLLAARNRQITVRRNRAKFTKDYHLDRVLANITLKPASASATDRLESLRLKVAAKGSPELG